MPFKSLSSMITGLICQVLHHKFQSLPRLDHRRIVFSLNDQPLGILLLPSLDLIPTAVSTNAIKILLCITFCYRSCTVQTATIFLLQLYYNLPNCARKKHVFRIVKGTVR